MVINVTKTLLTPLTIKTGAYVSGRVVGGLLDFTALCGAGGGGMILQAVISDAANQKKALKLYLFDNNPTVLLDDAVYGASFVIGDIDAHIATLDFLAADYVAVNSLANCIVGALPDTDKLSIPHGTGKLYGYLVTAEGVTYASATALKLKLIGWKD